MIPRVTWDRGPESNGLEFAENALKGPFATPLSSSRRQRTGCLNLQAGGGEGRWRSSPR